MKSSKGPCELNQDNALLRDYAARAKQQRYLCLAAVADGVGGRRAGEVASENAVTLLNEEFNARRSRYAEDGTLKTEDLLREIFSLVNMAIHDMGVLDESLRGMSTTLTAFLAEEGTLHIAHVGNSRAYLLRGGSITQLTKDHTLVENMVREGVITQQQAAIHSNRNIITRAMGMEEKVDIDLLTIPIIPEDVILLCTDGLHSVVEPGEMLLAVNKATDMQSACNELVREAEIKGTTDNVTALLWKVPALSASASATPRLQEGGQTAGKVDPGTGYAGSVGTVRMPARAAGTIAQKHQGGAASTGAVQPYRAGWLDRLVGKWWAVAVIAVLAVIGFLLGWLAAGWLRGGDVGSDGKDNIVAAGGGESEPLTESNEDKMRKGSSVMIRYNEGGEMQGEELKRKLEEMGYKSVKASPADNQSTSPRIYVRDNGKELYDLLLKDIPFRAGKAVEQGDFQVLRTELKSYDAVLALVDDCLDLRQ
jgi:protein phosphatase